MKKVDYKKEECTVYCDANKCNKMLVVNSNDYSEIIHEMKDNGWLERKIGDSRYDFCSVDCYICYITRLYQMYHEYIASADNPRKKKLEMKKQELMSLCRDVNEVHDCGLCRYEYTDTCSQRLEETEKEINDL